MKSGITTTSKVGALLGGGYIGLFWPDVDLLLLSVLHHRSIVTHSIFIALILYRIIPKPFYAGLLYGISVHLWADSLSTTTGFAQVYLPLVKVGIGGTLTFAWLIGNSIIGLILATICYRSLPWQAITAYLGIALIYAVSNEGAQFTNYVLSAVGIAMTLKYRSKIWKHLHAEEIDLLRRSANHIKE